MRSPLLALLLAPTAALVLAGCGSEAAPYDDGSDSSLQAGAPAALEAVGIELVAPTVPPGVDLDAVEAALTAAGLPAPQQSTPANNPGLAVDTTKVAGLLGTVGGRAPTKIGEQQYVVLVFDEPDSAVVWAESAPAVFDDNDIDDAAQGYVAGSLVGFYVPSDEVDETPAFVGAFEQLAGLNPTPSSNGSTS